MINDIDPNYIQMEITAVLTVLFFGFLIWVNRDRNKKYQDLIINVIAFLFAGLLVGVFIFAIYKIVGD